MVLFHSIHLKKKYLIELKINMEITKLLIVVILASFLTSCGVNEDNDGTAGSKAQNAPDSLSLTISEVVGIGKIEPETQILSLASERSGIVREVLKNDGDIVKKGDELIFLDSQAEVLDIELIEARIRTLESQAEYDQNSVIESELNLEYEKRILQSSTRLLEEGAETSRNVDDLETEVKVLEAGLARSKANLSMTISKLSELKVELRTAQMELDKRKILAPSNGIILDMKATRGSSLIQYSEFAEFAPEGRIIARCEVDEMFSSKVITGQAARITPVGRQEVLATGKVIRTSPFLKRKSLFSETPGDREDRRVREVWILLDNNVDLLFNMQVECIIKL
jgi:HlyD family secretion protein